MAQTKTASDRAGYDKNYRLNHPEVRARITAGEMEKLLQIGSGNTPGKAIRALINEHSDLCVRLSVEQHVILQKLYQGVTPEEGIRLLISTEAKRRLL